MTEEQKRKAIHEFFVAPRPVLYWKALVVGGSLFLLGAFAAAQGIASLGWVLIAVGVLWSAFVPARRRCKGVEPANEVQYFSLARYSGAKARYDARPAFRQMFGWLQQDISGVERESKVHLGIEEATRQPITVFGPIYHDIEGIDPSLVLRRKVGERYFYSTYRLSVFQFCEDFLGAFQANFSMIKNVTTSEETDEFFYRDVVSVRTQTTATSYTLKTGEKLVQSKMFALAVASGDKISVIIDDPKFKVSVEIESLGDEAVKNIRSMLRQFKRAPQVTA